jgi:hypothetical protein
VKRRAAVGRPLPGQKWPTPGHIGAIGLKRCFQPLLAHPWANLAWHRPALGQKWPTPGPDRAQNRRKPLTRKRWVCGPLCAAPLPVSRPTPLEPPSNLAARTSPSCTGTAAPWGLPAAPPSARRSSAAATRDSAATSPASTVGAAIPAIAPPSAVIIPAPRWLPPGVSSTTVVSSPGAIGPPWLRALRMHRSRGV